MCDHVRLYEFSDETPHGGLPISLDDFGDGLLTVSLGEIGNAYANYAELPALEVIKLAQVLNAQVKTMVDAMEGKLLEATPEFLEAASVSGGVARVQFESGAKVAIDGTCWVMVTDDSPQRIRFMREIQWTMALEMRAAFLAKQPAS